MTDQETDKRRLRVYGVGLSWYNEQFERQGGGCWVCSSPPGTRRLNIDHDHKAARLKLTTYKVNGLWTAMVKYRGEEVAAAGFTSKSGAVQACRQFLKKLSVRGLLCHRCNKGLQHFKDKPELLEKAIRYLRYFNDGNAII